MRYVPLKDAKVGMRLAQDMYDSLGRTLIGVNARVTEYYLEKLKTYGFDGIYIQDEFSKDIQLEPDDGIILQQGTKFGKRFANSGGVTAAVLQSMKENNENLEIKVCKANGAAECKKALLLMKAGKLPDDFIEGMACEGGCVGGPSSFNDMVSTKKFRDDMIEKADDRSIEENLSDYDMDCFSMHR